MFYNDITQKKAPKAKHICDSSEKAMAHTHHQLFDWIGLLSLAQSNARYPIPLSHNLTLTLFFSLISNSMIEMHR